MVYKNDSGVITSTADVALTRALRVKSKAADPTRVVLADATEKELGTVRAAVAAGDPVAICLRTKQGTDIFVADGAIANGAVVSTADGGKVETGAADRIGVALMAAAADGDLIAVLRD